MKLGYFTAGVVGAFALLASASYAQNDDCSGLDPNSLMDGQTYVETSKGWVQFFSVSALGLTRPTTLQMIYVVRPLFRDYKTGVLVIKSNRQTLDTDNEEATKKVRLMRGPTTSDQNCERVADFPKDGATVSTQAYEDYHDYPAPDTPAIRRDEHWLKIFHFAYRSGAQKRCVRTDDDNYDAFPWNLNSNRAQFSYNKNVVKSGVHGSWRLYFPVPSPFNGTAEHQTRAVKYETTSGLACVHFSIPVKLQEYTIRINDLEGREKPPSNNRLPEKRLP